MGWNDEGQLHASHRTICGLALWHTITAATLPYCCVLGYYAFSPRVWERKLRPTDDLSAGQPFAFFTSSTKAGTTSNRSPTIPYSATSKMGAFVSLLIATMVFARFIPTNF